MSYIDANWWAAEGFTVTHSNNGKHWQFRSPDLALDAWPTTDEGDGKIKWMAFGKVFKAGAGDVAKAYKAGRFTMPPEASEAKCRSCEAPIWWVKTAKGKNMPLDRNGLAHWSTCPHADLHRDRTA